MFRFSRGLIWGVEEALYLSGHGASEGMAGRERQRGRGRGGGAAGRRQSPVPTISLGCRPVAAHAVRNLVGDFNCVKADFFGGELMSDRLVSQG